MRVLICHERYEPDFAGGGETIVRETARHLAGLGVGVQVLTTGDPSIRSVDGIPTVRLPMHRYRFNLASGHAFALARDADVIQTFNYHACLPALAAGRRARKPVVCGMLGLFGDEWTHMRGSLVGAAFRAWERFLLRRPFDRVLFFSDFSRDLGIRLGVDPERAFVVAPGVDPAFRPAPAKDDAVLFASKLDPRKGVEELLAVARALPGVRFRVVDWSPHPSAAPLWSLPNVEVLPFARGEALHGAFARARVFFFPSRAETFGLVLAEAMASGCAIVSTVDVGFAGKVVGVGDVDAMTRAVRELWDDRERAAEMGRENVERARGFTWKRYAETLLSTYETLLESGAGTGPRA